MKQIAKDSQNNWYKIPVEPKYLSKLTKRSNIKGWLQTGTFLLLLVLLGSISFYLFSQQLWVLFALTFYIYTTIAGFAGMEAAVHELSHGTVFKNKIVNDFFYKLFCFFAWNNWVHFRYSHRKHHHETLIIGRDYEQVIQPMKRNYIWIVYRFLFDFEKIYKRIKPSLYHFCGSTKVDFFSWDELFPKNDPNRKKMITWARLLVIGHLILIAIFIYFRLYILIAIVNFPSFFATWLSHGCGMLQHKGLPSNIRDWRKSCYTFIPFPVIRFLYWNMNYHIEHHSYAAVPCYNLKKLHKFMVAEEPAPLDGYLRGLLHLFKVMLRQQQDPTYCYEQQLPVFKNNL